MKIVLMGLSFLLSSSVFASSKFGQESPSASFQYLFEKNDLAENYPDQLRNGTYSQRNNTCYSVVTYSPHREMITMRWSSRIPYGTHRCKNEGDFDQYVYSGYGRLYYGLAGTDAGYGIEVLNPHTFVFISADGTPNNMYTREY